MLSSRDNHCSPFGESLGVYVGKSFIAKDTENSGFSASPTPGCLRPPTLTISSSWLPLGTGQPLSPMLEFPLDSELGQLTWKEDPTLGEFLCNAKTQQEVKGIPLTQSRGSCRRP